MKKFRWDIYSNDNTLFVTSQCNNHCLMCAQPPLKRDDVEFHFRRSLKLLEHAPVELPTIGISGGEPTLLGDRLFELLKQIRETLPETTIQLLSNGRAFADPIYTEKLNNVGLDRLLISIPLHSDFCGDHDEITQVKGSWSETMHGLYQLACFKAEIELRIVIQKKNWRRLPKVAEFIYRNLPFVGSVVFMGLAIQHEVEVWIDPAEYQQELERAVSILNAYDIPVAIFNLPHCLLPPGLYPYACQSISDWKVFFPETCDSCCRRQECCGLFSTSRKHSEKLHLLTY